MRARLRKFAPVLREFAIVLRLVCGHSSLIFWKCSICNDKCHQTEKHRSSVSIQTVKAGIFALSPIQLRTSAQETHTQASSWDLRGHGTYAAHREQKMLEFPKNASSTNSIKLKFAFVAPNWARMWMGCNFMHKLRVQVYRYIHIYTSCTYYIYIYN